jgi:hypothetical protein
MGQESRECDTLSDRNGINVNVHKFPLTNQVLLPKLGFLQITMINSRQNYKNKIPKNT